MAVAAPGIELGASRRFTDALGFLRRTPIIPLLIIGLMIFMAVFAPLLAPHPPNQQYLTDRLKPPVWQEGGSSEYLLGTDRLGRDMLSRMIHGSRVSLVVLGATLAVGGIAGLMIGIISGYMGGIVDTLLMRVVDGFIAVPGLLIALLFAVTLGPGIFTITLAISLFTWSTFARVIRGEVLTLRHQDFVSLAVVHGCSPMRVMVMHMLPNVVNTWMVLATLNAGSIIITEASLSFLGAGVPPPDPAWGQIVSEGREFVSTAWWIAIIPGVAITLVVLSFNLMGDWLRDLLDPRLRALR